MYDLPKEQALKLKELENIATEKRIAYQKIDSELFSENGSDNVNLLPEYTKAKSELTQAVDEYNRFKSNLANTYQI